FAMDTDILLMDEPFSALDPLIRAQLQDELILLQEKLNKTILFVSHDLDEALKIGNNIAIMESGKLIQHGKPEQIILAPENDYVADFVAHTNPLNVLKGRSLMRDDLVREDTRVLICPDKDIWVIQESKGLSLADNGKSLIQWKSNSSNLDEVNENSLVQVSPEISMREAIELKQRSNQPLLMVEDNKLVGVLSDNELYDALLGNFKSEQVA
ncbi:choline ABC transporter ATP-binding protein, partial [Vibrio parahaemolyticus]|nr:choline ABC transporter ATP-binding protein [Vibrio parahaemolyticus]